MKKLLAETVEQFKATTGDEPCAAYEIYCGICESITIARQEKTNERTFSSGRKKLPAVCQNAGMNMIFLAL